MDIGKRFDAVANRYDTPEKYKRSEDFLKAILENLPGTKNFKVMDIGAGTGILDIMLAPYVKEIVAFDLSEGMLNVFKEKIEKNNINNIRIYKHDILSEGFPEKDFDLIITSMTFHHLDDPIEVLKKLKEYLKTGGYIAVIDLYKEDGTFHSDNTDVKHFGFDEKDVENWLKETGLEKVKYQIVHTITKEREGHKRDYPVFMIMAIKR